MSTADGTDVSESEKVHRVDEWRDRAGVTSQQTDVLKSQRPAVLDAPRDGRIDVLGPAGSAETERCDRHER